MIPMAPRGTRWINRCKRLVFPMVGCSVVRADETTGVMHILAEERSVGLPTLWINLRPRDVDDDVAVGNQLVEAFRRAFRTDFLGLGAPLGLVVAKLRKYQGILGPSVVVVSGAQRNPRAVATLRSLAGSGSSLVLIVNEDTQNTVIGSWRPDCIIEADRLHLTIPEAIEIAHGAMPPDRVPAVLAKCGGRFVLFVNTIRDRSGLAALHHPAPTGFATADPEFSGVPAELVLSAFRRRNEHIEGFEYVVQESQVLAADAIREAGPQYVASGMTKRLLQQIELLPMAMRRSSDDLMRWWFAASISEYRLGSVRSEVERVLDSREAPELRALYAAAFPGPELLSETQRALAALRTPVTLRMYGFALGQQSACSAGIAFLMKALRLSEALADPDQVVGAATDIANYYLIRGHYQDGAEWSAWAIEQHYSLNGKDELRRLAAVGLLAFSRILVEDLVGLEQLLDDLYSATDQIGGPTSEVINSTLGDWAVVSGDFVAAEEHYRRNLERLPREQYHRAALDLVPVLRALGRDAEARVIGRRVRSMTRDSDEISCALGMLAHALSIVGIDNNAAAPSLEFVCKVLGRGTEAHRLAQASVALARVRLSQQDISGAHRALKVGAPGLRGLGKSGWRLVSSWERDLDEVMGLFQGESVSLGLRFLGQTQCITGVDVKNLTKRNAECVAAIATSRRGLNLERLSIALYGDHGSIGTTKARVSRLRSTIPLTSRPYRIAVPFRADFLDLMEHLEHGRVRQALSLYRGPLLPESEAPAVVELREHIDESLRQAVLASGDHEAMLELAKRTDDQDLELLEAAASHMPQNDPQSPLLRARIRQIRRDWGSEDDFNR